MSIVREISASWGLSIAAVRLHGTTTEFSFPGGEPRIESLSSIRIMCFLCIQAARVAIAVRLGLGGVSPIIPKYWLNLPPDFVAGAISI